VVTGRLVDRAGKPMPGAHIYFYRDKSFTDATTQTDAEGRFRAELVSGVKYSIGSNNFNRVQLLKSGVLVEAGRTVELGDVSPIE
jgi:hypothetical protein